jgi:hypothetical protein
MILSAVSIKLRLENKISIVDRYIGFKRGSVPASSRAHLYDANIYFFNHRSLRVNTRFQMPQMNYLRR